MKWVEFGRNFSSEVIITPFLSSVPDQVFEVNFKVNDYVLPVLMDDSPEIEQFWKYAFLLYQIKNSFQIKGI